jgi:predicted transcriptional regulator of viral defense system
MREYGSHPERDFERLVSVARRAGRGAAWKRLGYLAETLWPAERSLIDDALSHLTAGYVKLDPGVSRRGVLVRRWRLWVNVPIAAASNEA